MDSDDPCTRHDAYRKSAHHIPSRQQNNIPLLRAPYNLDTGISLVDVSHNILNDQRPDCIVPCRRDNTCTCFSFFSYIIHPANFVQIQVQSYTNVACKSRPAISPVRHSYTTKKGRLHDNNQRANLS
jgi:hypothetical protein